MRKIVKIENGKPIKIEQVEEVLQDFKEEVKETRKNKPKTKSKLRAEWLNKALQEDLIKKYSEPLKLISERYNGIIFLYEIEKLKDFENKAIFDLFFNINALNRKVWNGKAYYLLTSTVSRILDVPKVKDTPQTVKKQYIINQIWHNKITRLCTYMNASKWVDEMIVGLQKHNIKTDSLESHFDYMTLRRNYFITSMQIKNLELSYERKIAKGLLNDDQIEAWKTTGISTNEEILKSAKESFTEASKTYVFKYFYKKNKKAEPVEKYVCIDDLEQRNIFFGGIGIQSGKPLVQVYHLDINKKLDISKAIEIYKFVDDFLTMLGFKRFKLYLAIDKKYKNVDKEELKSKLEGISAINEVGLMNLDTEI